MTSSQTERTNEVSDSDNEITDLAPRPGGSSESETPTRGQRKQVKFDFSEWSPEAPAGLQFLCLIPILSGYEAKYPQSDHVGKLKVSTRHRQNRLKQFKTGKTVLKNIADEKKLRQAANQNDYGTVLELLESGVDPSCPDDKSRTPLHMAAARGNELVVKMLLDHGADPNKTDVLGNTPLHLAACTIASHISVVTQLLKAGTNLRAVDRCGRTPLSFAKSRLRVVMTQSSNTSDKMKSDIAQVIEMMQEYLKLSGMSEDARQLDALCHQLQNTTTIEQVHQINQLLSDFTSMTIQKKSAAKS